MQSILDNKSSIDHVHDNYYSKSGGIISGDVQLQSTSMGMLVLNQNADSPNNYLGIAFMKNNVLSSYIVSDPSTGYVGGYYNGSFHPFLDSTNFANYAAAKSHSHAYLPLTGGAISGPVRRDYSDSTHVYHNVAYTFAGTSKTGTLKIVLPKTWSNTMIFFEIDIFQYNATVAGSGDSTKILCGFYNYAPSPGYYHGFADVSNTSLINSVRFAHDGSNCCILLGTTASKWMYTTVNISKVMATYGATTGWDTGYSFEWLTSETGLSNIYTALLNPKLEGYNHICNGRYYQNSIAGKIVSDTSASPNSLMLWAY